MQLQNLKDNRILGLEIFLKMRGKYDFVHLFSSPIFIISVASKMAILERKESFGGKIGSFFETPHGPLRKLHQKALVGCENDKIQEILRKI